MHRAALVTLPLIAGSVLIPMGVVQPASASTMTAGRCSVFSYIGTRKVSTFVTAPSITHATQHGIGAHTSETVTESAAFQTEITAATKYSGGASGSVNWLWGSVSAHFGVTVAHSKAHTSTKTVTIKKHVSNSSNHNRTYVAYRGVTRYTGRYYTTYCGGADSSGIGTIKKHWGSYVTFAGSDEGFLYCRGGASSAIERAAIKLYCK